MLEQYEISLPEYPRGFHLITGLLTREMGVLPGKGLVHLFLKHTSAALTLNENADPTVRNDFESFVNHWIPEKGFRYLHTLEGMDDMPAHIKSSVFGQSLSIPVTDGRLNLGIWQGIYLCEFRNSPGRRQVVITILGD